MDIIKDEKTAALDELTRLADETLVFYRDLLGQIADAGLHDELSKVIAEQDNLLRELKRDRRAHDELPQAGDPELAHLQALAARVRAFFEPDRRDAKLSEALMEATERLKAELRKLGEQEGLPTADLLFRYRASCEAFERALLDRGAL